MMEPTVRFPEFKGSWNNYKIEDMFDRVGTPVDLDDTQTYREIGIRSHGKGIFHKEETTAIEIGNKRVFWVEPDCFVVNIVFAWERAVAKTTEKENGMIASHRFPMYKPKKDVVDLDYITEYFITKRGQNVLILASPGGAGRNKTLGQKEFAKSVVKLPSLPEQQKIADFLSTIDTVIKKQKETVSAWEERKKGVMQKLFSQEVRFKADDGSDFPEWEEKKLGECGRFYTGVGFSEKYQGHKGLDVDVYKVSDMNIIGNEKYMTLSNNTVDDSIVEQMKTKVITSKCLVFAKVGAAIYGERKRITTKPFLIDNNMMAFEPCSCLNIEYLHSWSCSVKFSQYAQVGALPSYNSSDIGIIKIHIPCPEEQQKIADCLSSLDEVIEKQKATLAAWEELKKGLLQQMFV
ncbi:restriction endonuclease subunit S [Eubacterium ramulus]|uniref:restriction endonuclease subunit S n=1 Tax=Eubacterium ramulus TaxID=39490 RepID=UPI00241E3C9B|nr:restriction endonuclease subunit S [Eubacterium ramulus]